ncbi:phytanoyl-CoA dioxygenase family protein [Pedobacter sp. FW305-3-2-15-E-R2A2]|uniref:phytanoyl-CoA dioxygenase family protein n=1 Tax=Pedobacter sp. FW305-3-2-15-E-R2A2 TaxID=3140251 RepID=UPI0031400A78
MTDCNFTTLFYETHQQRRIGKNTSTPDNFDQMETIWLSFYGLGKFETYFFLYADCKDFQHFKDWVAQLKGQDFLIEADRKFKEWQNNQNQEKESPDNFPKILSPEQLQFWEENGYLKISNVVDETSCDQVKQAICRHLNLDMNYPATWYMKHPDWQGIMVQLYQNEAIEAIRKQEKIKAIFADLYRTNDLVPNTEKLGYNPPECEIWGFPHGQLHWDINFDKPVPFEVQGILYLNEVPQNRGPIHLVPGFHHRFEEWIAPFASLERAHTSIRLTEVPQPVTGEKGDLILWRNTIPHAAGSNNSDHPRFVQYLSFSKL